MSICLMVVANDENAVDGPSYLGNDDLHPHDLNALERE